MNALALRKVASLLAILTFGGVLFKAQRGVVVGIYVVLLKVMLGCDGSCC